MPEPVAQLDDVLHRDGATSRDLPADRTSITPRLMRTAEAARYLGLGAKAYLDDDAEWWKLERVGVDFLNLADLDPRIAYAVRRTGGLHRFNQQLGHSTYAFLERDFAEAYNNYEWAEQMDVIPIWRQLEQELTAKQLKGQVRPQLPAAQEKAQPFLINKVPEPLTDGQLRDRREMLRQQVESLKRVARC